MLIISASISSKTKTLVQVSFGWTEMTPSLGFLKWVEYLIKHQLLSILSFVKICFTWDSKSAWDRLIGLKCDQNLVVSTREKKALFWRDYSKICLFLSWCHAFFALLSYKTVVYHYHTNILIISNQCLNIYRRHLCHMHISKQFTSLFYSPHKNWK